MWSTVNWALKTHLHHIWILFYHQKDFLLLVSVIKASVRSGILFIQFSLPRVLLPKAVNSVSYLFANRGGKGALCGSPILAEYSPESTVTHTSCTRPARWEIRTLISLGPRCCLLINITFKGHVSEMRQSRDSTHIYRCTCWALQGHCLFTCMLWTSGSNKL